MTLTAVVAMTMCTACLALCQPLQTDQAISDAARSSDYAKLSQQVYMLYNDPDSERLHISDPRRVSVIEAKMQDILRGATTRWLAAPDPSEAEIRSELSSIQGDLALGDASMTNTPFARFFEVSGRRCVVVGYAILEGAYAEPDTRPFLDFYVRSADGWRLQDSAGSDFRGMTFLISPYSIRLGRRGLVPGMGTVIGASGAPMSIRIYSFDGNYGRTVWKRDGLLRCELNLSDNSVTLEYDKEYRQTRAEEVLHITPNGLQ